MKHLLNNLSEEEKNSIREQHTDRIKIDTSRFKSLMESKLGDVKPLVEQVSQLNLKPNTKPNPPEIPKTNLKPSQQTPKEDLKPLDLKLSDSNKFVGKTVTFYTNKKDAEAASAAGKSNPSSTGSVLGKITKVENPSSSVLVPSTDEIVLWVDFEYSEKPNEGGYTVVYNRTKGSFNVRAWEGVEYYNESLRKALDSTYFTTDFASKQKPLGSIV
jgi:hypothetical protein